MNLKKSMPVILSVVGSVGTIATAILTAKATPRAMKKYEDLKKEKEKPTKMDIAKKVIPSYVPAVIVGTATIASIVSSTLISQKQQASLAATCMMLDQGWRKYKGKVKEVLGVDAHQNILNEIANDDYREIPDQTTVDDGKRLYWEEHLGYFRANPEHFAFATSDLNQRLQIVDYVAQDYYVSTLQNLINDSGAELLDEDKKNVDFSNIGWSMDYLAECFEYCWIHVHLDPIKLEDGVECYKVYFDEDPIYDPESFEYDDGRTEFMPDAKPEDICFIPEEEKILAGKVTK